MCWFKRDSPKLEERIVALKEGDILVFTCEQNLSEEQIEKLSNQVSSLGLPLNQHKILLIDGGIRFTVLHPGDK